MTLRRGLRLLHVLAEHPDGLSISQLAAELDTHRAGVYRLLAPLLDERFVQRLPDGRHRLGIGLVELSSRVAPRLQEAVLPELRRLADELGATAAMTVRDGEEAVVMAVVEPRNSRMHLAYRVGIRHSVERGASGIAILAARPYRDGERPEVTEARARGFVRTQGEILAGGDGHRGRAAGRRRIRGGEHQSRLGRAPGRGERRARPARAPGNASSRCSAEPGAVLPHPVTEQALWPVWRRSPRGCSLRPRLTHSTVVVRVVLNVYSARGGNE